MINSINRMAAMTARYYYLLRSSWLRLAELIFWPAMQMLVWGFLYTYLYDSKSSMASTGGMLLGAVLLWDVLFRGQLGFTFTFLEEIWSRNVANLMMSPLQPAELAASLMAMSLLRLADRHPSGDVAGVRAVRLQHLRTRLPAARVLHQSGVDRLGDRTRRVRHDASARASAPRALLTRS